jgi:hypothetical protein
MNEQFASFLTTFLTFSKYQKRGWCQPTQMSISNFLYKTNRKKMWIRVKTRRSELIRFESTFFVIEVLRGVDSKMWICGLLDSLSLPPVCFQISNFAKINYGMAAVILLCKIAKKRSEMYQILITTASFPLKNGSYVDISFDSTTEAMVIILRVVNSNFQHHRLICRVALRRRSWLYLLYQNVMIH